MMGTLTAMLVCVPGVTEVRSGLERLATVGSPLLLTGGGGGIPPPPSGIFVFARLDRAGTPLMRDTCGLSFGRVDIIILLYSVYIRPSV